MPRAKQPAAKTKVHYSIQGPGEGTHLSLELLALEISVPAFEHLPSENGISCNHTWFRFFFFLFFPHLPRKWYAGTFELSIRDPYFVVAAQRDKAFVQRTRLLSVTLLIDLEIDVCFPQDFWHREGGLRDSQFEDGFRARKVFQGGFQLCIFNPRRRVCRVMLSHGETQNSIKC